MLQRMAHHPGQPPDSGPPPGPYDHLDDQRGDRPDDRSGDRHGEQRPHYYGHRARLRARMQQDPRSLADYEILELLLGQTILRSDTKPLAKRLLERFGSLRAVMKAPVRELLRVPGFGQALASAWTLQAELAARVAEAPVREHQVLSGPAMVAEGAKARFGSGPVEEFWVALVDNQNRVIAWERVSRGTVDQTAVFPREVLALALSHHASGVILVHNHPGGNLKPSEEDRLLTARINRAAQELGVRILDHLIVTEESHYSFQEHGLL